MATLTDIALNDPPAVEALARNPLSLVGTAADPTGTAAATAAADEATLAAFYGDVAPFRTATRNALKGIYADQERLLREQRVGMTKGERLLETLAAFGQPVSGGMGEALANAARATTARNQSEREADRARQNKLAELSLAQKLEQAKLDMSFGEKVLDRRATEAKAAIAARKPLSTDVVVDANDQVRVIQTFPDNSIVVRALNPDGTVGPVIPPPASATAVPSTVTGAQVAAGPRTLPAPSTSTERPSAPRTGVAVGATFRGVDGKLYVKTATGQREVEGASPEFEADRAEKIKLAEKGAEATVDLQKEAEVKASAAKMSQLFIDDSTKLIESGQIITGLGANVKLQALRARAAMKDEAAAAQVVATETFQINAANQVLSIIKNFGTGSAVSDADRAYATKMAGGDITLNEGSLARILKILTASNNYAQSEAKRLGGVGTRPTVASGAYRYDASGKRVPNQ